MSLSVIGDGLNCASLSATLTKSHVHTIYKIERIQCTYNIREEITRRGCCVTYTERVLLMLFCSVADPSHFDVDPVSDPGIHLTK